ncbi:MAG TPA: alpha-L-glutamate ligase-like protein [Chromatiales bacterium]|nr:alpha-L-glutamate ligase-like protein [Chromatiales bacterium]
MFASSRHLRERGVMGMNERNANFVQRFNQRSHYPLVDDKLQTKRLAMASGIAVPELYAVMSTPADTRDLAERVAGREQFVIKPTHGSGGDGIMVITGRNVRRAGLYRLSDGSVVSESDIRYHVTNIISGRYSLGGHRDCAMIEYCVQADPVFAEVAHNGVPDVRVLVFRGYPAMAMVRLPTRESKGKANLHQGAVGAGIDLSTGRTVYAVHDSQAVEEHPDTGALVTGIEVPHWQTLLELAASCYDLTGLGYLGVDLVLDRDRGPLILELNARPGLGIQIANRMGLRTRLAMLEERPDGLPVAERLKFVRTEFGVSAQAD